MRKYLAPLEVFVIGQLLLLGAFLLLPALDTATTQLAAETAPIASVFWGWSWAPTVGKYAFIIAAELAILWATAKAFLAIKD